MVLPPRTAPGVGAVASTGAKLLGQTVGGYFGGPVGGAVAGMAGQALADYFSPQARALRQQTSKDVAALEKGQLGFSEAEKRTMLAGTQRSLQAQTAGVEANLRRQAAAAGGFGRSGAQTNALAQLASAQGEQLAQRAGQVDALSQQTAQQRFTDIMGRLGRKREEQMTRLGGAVQALGQTPAAYGVASQAVQKAEKTRLAKFAAEEDAKKNQARAAQEARAGGQ
jgi:hypothetical protein